ncbi:MAG TPA: pyridoxal-phosphate dependent enzyme [Roseateles sp.]|nr:pyridoxal-phosphate dependent enzyme [Roseateles sp.]
MASTRAAPAKKSASYYQDLETMLLRRLKDEPRNAELRLSLVELYFETGRQGDFVKEAGRLRQLADPASSEWRKVQSMGRMLAPEEPLFQAAQGEAVEFVSVDPLSASLNKSGVRRIGEGEKYRKHFEKLAGAVEKQLADSRFLPEFDMELVRFAGRPTSLFHAARLSQQGRGAQIYFKREDLSPQYPHLVINLVGQMFMAQRLGRKTVVLGSVHGHTGVIAASVAAHFGLSAIVYMHSEDIARNSTNVFRMWLMGAQVEAAHVKHESTDNIDVRQAAVEHWARNPDDCFLAMGLDAAPHPFPLMAQEFTGVIGREARRQMQASARRAPDLVVARAGENADAIGFFTPFLKDKDTRLVCVAGGDLGVQATASPTLQESVFDPRLHRLSSQETRKAGAVLEGLEYPSLRREHALLKASGRVEYVDIKAEKAKQAISAMSRLEGVVPAIQTAHVVAWACDAAARMQPEQAVLVMLAESSDKDIWDIARATGLRT